MSWKKNLCGALVGCAKKGVSTTLDLPPGFAEGCLYPYDLRPQTPFTNQIPSSMEQLFYNNLVCVLEQSEANPNFVQHLFNTPTKVHCVDASKEFGYGADASHPSRDVQPWFLCGEQWQCADLDDCDDSDDSDDSDVEDPITNIGNGVGVARMAIVPAVATLEFEGLPKPARTWCTHCMQRCELERAIWNALCMFWASIPETIALEVMRVPGVTKDNSFRWNWDDDLDHNHTVVILDRVPCCIRYRDYFLPGPANNRVHFVGEDVACFYDDVADVYVPLRLLNK
jgi:hypothetical protein